MKTTKKFTLIELLIVIAIIAILAAMLLPALNMARDKAKGISCLNNLKQLGTFFNMYVDNYNEWIPACSGSSGNNANWIEKLVEDNSSVKQKSFICPSATHNQNDYWFTNTPTWLANAACSSYAYNINFAGYNELAGIKVNKVTKPSTKIFLLDSQRNGTSMVGRYKMIFHSDTLREHVNFGFPPLLRHGHTVNFSCGDGHVETVRLNPNIASFNQEPFRWIHWSVGRLLGPN